MVCIDLEVKHACMPIASEILLAYEMECYLPDESPTNFGSSCSEYWRTRYVLRRKCHRTVSHVVQLSRDATELEHH